MSYIPCMVYANRVLLTCMYHINFAYGRFSPVRGCGFLVVAHVAPLRGRGWFRLGSVTTNRLTGAKLAAGHGPWVLSRVGCFPGCRVGRCRVFPWTRAVCCTCGHMDAPNDMFIFLYFIMSHYIYTQRFYYICMSYYISTQRFYYICSFYDILVHIGTVYSCTICGRILALG